VLVESEARRDAVKSSFVRANAKALENYCGDQRALYARLKLEGLKEAPVHLAVFADEATLAGSGLGRQTMPQTLQYSVVGAIQTLWLAARADGVALLDALRLVADLSRQIGEPLRRAHGSTLSC